MTIKELQQKKRIVILGYAREGKATERFLKQFVPGAEIIIADQALNPDYLELQKKGDLIIKTPVIPKSKVLGEYTTATNIFFANISHPERMIGVTGSKGKSTTASLIAAMIKASGQSVQLIGNIGRPALDAFCDGINDRDVIVMELSSYQLDDIHYSPHIAVFTSLFPEHLDYHGGFDEYVKAKANITKFQTSTDFFIYQPTHDVLQQLAKSTKASSLPFKKTLPFSTKESKLIGEHNLENIRAAWTVVHLFDVKPEQAEEALKTFEPLPHRLTNIGTYKRIVFIDDAIATAPEPTMLAIETLKNIDTIFLGGTDRGYSFDQLVSTLEKYKIKNLVLFPETGARIKKALAKQTNYHPTILETTDMKAAVEFAFQVTEPGKICLLSTASPSYSLWKNYEEKGENFTKYVKELGQL